MLCQIKPAALSLVIATSNHLVPTPRAVPQLSGQVQAFEELIAQIHAHRVDLDATTLSDIADAFCHLSVFADLGVKVRRSPCGV